MSLVPPLQLDRLEVDAEWSDTIAVTNVSLTVSNPGSIPREAVLDVPLSDSAVLTAFTLFDGNRTLEGIVQERQQAQTNYEEASRRGENTVLLRSAGRGLLSLQVNVRGGGQVVLNATYAEIVPVRLGGQTWALPTASFAPAGPVGTVSIRLSVSSAHGWAGLRAQGLPARIDTNEAGATVAYDAQDAVLDEDLRVVRTPASSGYRSSLVVSHLGPDAAAVLALLAPLEGETALPKDIVFVLDRSGSMSGAKIQQAREALSAILDQLRATDRFGLVRFDDSIQGWRASLTAVTAANVAAAQGWTHETQAGGATDIEGGLRKGLSLLSQREGAVPMVVLVTDGLPTAGVTSLSGILRSVEEHNPFDARIHVVGIGFDQDNAFLSELAGSTRGLYRSVGPSDDVSAALSGFYVEISTAVLSDVWVTLEGLAFDDVHPSPVPDLYEGAHLVLAGRLNASELPDLVRVRIWGNDADGAVTRNMTVPRGEVVVMPEAAKLWARQKAASIERRLSLGISEDAEADRAALLDLGLAYQVATLETSWLIVEAQLIARPEPVNTFASGPGGVPTLTTSPTWGTATPLAVGDTHGAAQELADGGGGAPSEADAAGTPAPGWTLLVALVLGLVALRRRR